MNAWSDFWGDILEWMFENLMIPLVVLGGIGLVGLLGYIAYEEYNRDPMTQGVVVGKQHREAYTTTHMIFVGKVLVPQTIHHPERWVIELEGLTQGGKMARREFSVPKAQWDVIEIGAEMPIEP